VLGHLLPCIDVEGDVVEELPEDGVAKPDQLRKEASEKMEERK
jgi:hypothetical protein